MERQHLTLSASDGWVMLNYKVRGDTSVEVYVEGQNKIDDWNQVWSDKPKNACN